MINLQNDLIQQARYTFLEHISLPVETLRDVDLTGLRRVRLAIEVSNLYLERYQWSHAHSVLMLAVVDYLDAQATQELVTAIKQVCDVADNSGASFGDLHRLSDDLSRVCSLLEGDYE